MNSNQEKFEEALRGALRRGPAPAGFAAKVLAKAEGESGRARAAGRPRTGRPFVALALAAAVVAAIVPAVVTDYQRREAERGVKAKQELLTALAITRDQLQQARTKVQRRPGR